LCGGVVDLEDPKMRVRVAVGEGVEACTEQDVLNDALGYGLGKVVFGVAAAGDEKGAECHGKRPVGTRGCAMKFLSVGVAEDGDRDRVIEDKRLGVVELVGRAT